MTTLPTAGAAGATTGHAAGRRRHPVRRLLLLVVAAGALATVSARRRREQVAHTTPADTSFMRAIHSAFRRDLRRLQEVAPGLEGRADAGDVVQPVWRRLRGNLEFHHQAEDTDLWPVLRAHLSDPAGLHEVDEMVEEHRAIPRLLAAVDGALDTGVGVGAAVDALVREVEAHLGHEERTVLPLVEQHLTTAEWRTFLLTERDRRPASERPGFIAWLLDGATDSESAAVLRELPLPGRIVVEKMILPRYQATRRRELEASTRGG